MAEYFARAWEDDFDLQWGRDQAIAKCSLFAAFERGHGLLQ